MFNLLLVWNVVFFFSWCVCVSPEMAILCGYTPDITPSNVLGVAIWPGVRMFSILTSVLVPLLLEDSLSQVDMSYAMLREHAGTTLR